GESAVWADAKQANPTQCARRNCTGQTNPAPGRDDRSRRPRAAAASSGELPLRAGHPFQRILRELPGDPERGADPLESSGPVRTDGAHDGDGIRSSWDFSPGADVEERG